MIWVGITPPAIVCSCVGIIDLEWPGIDPFPGIMISIINKGFQMIPFFALLSHMRSPIQTYHIFHPILIIS